MTWCDENGNGQPLGLRARQTVRDGCDLVVLNVEPSRGARRVAFMPRIEFKEQRAQLLSL